MSVNIVWDDEQKTTIRFDYDGRWTWDEWYSAMDEAKSWIKEVGHPVYFINNAGNAMHLPPNAMTNFRQNAVHFAPHVRLTIVVRKSRFLQLMFNTFKQFAGHWAATYRFVSTLEEAQKTIEQDAKEREF